MKPPVRYFSLPSVLAYFLAMVGPKAIAGISLNAGLGPSSLPWIALAACLPCITLGAVRMWRSVRSRQSALFGVSLCLFLDIRRIHGHGNDFVRSKDGHHEHTEVVEDPRTSYRRARHAMKTGGIRRPCSGQAILHCGLGAFSGADREGSWRRCVPAERLCRPVPRRSLSSIVIVGDVALAGAVCVRAGRTSGPVDDVYAVFARRSPSPTPIFATAPFRSSSETSV